VADGLFYCPVGRRTSTAGVAALSCTCGDRIALPRQCLGLDLGLPACSQADARASPIRSRCRIFRARFNNRGPLRRATLSSSRDSQIRCGWAGDAREFFLRTDLSVVAVPLTTS
jgi:hypothetical protein